MYVYFFKTIKIHFIKHILKNNKYKITFESY